MFKPTPQTSVNDKYKAGGFINLSLPTAEGGKRKVAGIPLKLSDSRENALREFLEADPIANVAWFLANVTAEYQKNETRAGTEFALGAPPQVAAPVEGEAAAATPATPA